MNVEARYPSLFSPIRVGGKELANRLIMAPLYTGYATMEGRLSPYLVEHYRRMGASGLAITAIVHNLAMFVLTVLLVGHLYFTYVYSALSGMTTGYVSEEEARLEHAKWVDSLPKNDG